MPHSSVILGATASLAIGASAFAQQPQQPYPTQRQHVPGVPPLLQRVDPSIGDVSPLGESFRDMDMQIDLRTPSGFTNIYRVPGRDDLLMRGSGGMYAIFPQSVYVSTKHGTSALVPPGTVFSIGMPGPWLLSSLWATGPTYQPMMSDDAGSRSAAPAEARKPWAGSRPIDSRRYDRRDSLASAPAWDRDGAPALNERENERENESEIDPAALEGMPTVRIERATPPDPSTFLKTIVTDDAYRASRLSALMQQALRAARGDSKDE